MDEKQLNELLEKMLKSISEAQKESDAKLLEAVAKSNDILTQISKANPIGEDVKKELMHTDPAIQMATFVKAIKMGDKETLAKIKAHDPNDVQTQADGGYLVPALTMARIYELIATSGQALTECGIVPLTGVNTVYLPKKLTGATSYVVSEEASITSTKPTLAQFTLTPYKFATLMAVTNELLMSANVAIGQYLLNLAAQSQATLLDNRVFQDGNTTWEGVFYSSNTYGNDGLALTSGINANTLIYQNIIDAVYGVDKNYLVGAKWYMSRTVAAIVRGLVDLNNRPIWENNSGAMPPTLFGYPVEIVENAPTAPTTASKNFILLGNLKANSFLGDVSGLRIDMSNSATVDSDSAFQYDFTAIRMLKHWAFDYEPLAMATIKTAAA
jgi:HK97 family phage major capsid protein